jgi:hypothetical protein
MIGVALALLVAAAPAPVAHPDAPWRAALDLLYDGRTDAAVARLTQLQQERPRDPLGPYLQVLALCWKLEQRPESAAIDKEFLAESDRALATVDTYLRARPDDVRARLGRGAIRGVRSRFHLFRNQGANAAREASRMREDLALVREQDPRNGEAVFGMGVYDYYVDVLPRMARILRFLARMPAGDRARGLAQIEQAKDVAYLHHTEVQAQLYEIYSYYEDRPDAALREIRDLHRRYPGSPLWGLKLAEHLRLRLGDYEGSAAVGREILETSRSGHPNFASPAVATLARLAIGEALLLDGHTGDARQALLQVQQGAPGVPGLAGHARFLLGRTLEYEGDRVGAVAHYEAAQENPDKQVRRRAEDALDEPVPSSEILGRRALVAARRHRAAGQIEKAAQSYREAYALWPASTEAAHGVVEDEIRDGHLANALRPVADLGHDRPTNPSWVRAWGWLLRARVYDLEGARGSALLLYKKVQEQPHGRAELKEAAALGLQAPFRVAPPPAAPRRSPS